MQEHSKCMDESLANGRSCRAPKRGASIVRHAFSTKCACRRKVRSQPPATALGICARYEIGEPRPCRDHGKLGERGRCAGGQRAA